MKPICIALIFLGAAICASAQTDASQFSATVTKSDATFAMPIASRPNWTWRQPETADNYLEYRMDVTLNPEGEQYTFGFYLWKRAGSLSSSGRFEDLLAAGQKSLFVRSEARHMTLVHDAQVKVKFENDQMLVIKIKDHATLNRLFSSRPAAALFQIRIPGDQPVSQTIPIVYKD